MIDLKTIRHRLKLGKVENNVLCVFSDNDNSYLFHAVFKDCLCYVPERKSWYYFDGRRWVKDTGDVETELCAKNLANELYDYAYTVKGKNRNTVLNNAFKWQNMRTRKTVIDDARAYMSVSVNEFDAFPEKLNLKNGILDINTLEFSPHDSSYYFTRLANAEYDKNALSERFNLFIAEIMNDSPELVSYLQKALGYSLIGKNERECLFILYGATTRNGKSTLVETVLSVLGSYAASVNPETIANVSKNSNAPSEDVARLNGIRFAAISEPPEGLIFNASRVKTMTGNDTITARYLHENSFEFRPEFTLYINTNHLPAVTDVTLFKSERIRIIPFLRHFSREEQDSTLKESFRKEDVKSAVLNWLIKGYQLYKEEGLSAPRESEELLKEYEKSSDKISLFVSERLIKDEEASVPTSVIYEDYKSWCIQNGFQPQSRIKFSEKLKYFGEMRLKRINDKVTRVFSGYKLICNEL